LLVIGERINSSRRQIAQAVAARDAAVIRQEAGAQASAGADYLDVNAGTFVDEEAACLKWIIEVVQEVTDLPICLDSPDPEVIKSVLPLVKGKPMINSISLEPGRLNKILPLATEYNAKVIALCQAGDAMAETAEAKVRMAAQLVEKATSGGLPLGDLFIDPLVYPLSTNTGSALATLEAIDKIMGQFPGVHTTCGLTNVSYGLPQRKLVNRTFLVAAILRGLDSAILDPTDQQLYGSLKAALMVAGKDEFCLGYITAFREGRFV
jgi:5-methyltetrahydrofolate corrinoid/iron sulfur protein methyltransferase